MLLLRPANKTFTGPTARRMAERQDRIRLAAPHHGIACLRGLLTRGGDSESQGIIHCSNVPHVPGKHTDQRRGKEEDQ